MMWLKRLIIGDLVCTIEYYNLSRRGRKHKNAFLISIFGHAHILSLYVVSMYNMTIFSLLRDNMIDHKVRCVILGTYRMCPLSLF